MEHKGIVPTLLEQLEELLPAVIFGAEGEGDGGDDSSNSGEGDGDDNGAGSDGDQANKTGEHDDANDPKVIGLKTALERERTRAAKAERELAKRRKADEEAELAKKSEVEQAQTKLQQAEERATKLAAGYLQTALDRSIEKFARELNFHDIDDALKGVDRKDFAYEQDEDDPSVVTIDEKSIEKALKTLVAKKPHLLKSGTEDGEPTGGQFGRGNQKKKTSNEDEYKKKYPSLR